jgi:hypothetical protein
MNLEQKTRLYQQINATLALLEFAAESKDTAEADRLQRRLQALMEKAE